MKVLSLQRKYRDERYQTNSFRNVIEDHLLLLRYKNVQTTIIPTGRQIEKFALDFTGLLIEEGIPEDQHYATIRANGYFSSADFLDHEGPIRILKPNAINSLYERHLTNLYQR